MDRIKQSCSPFPLLKMFLLIAVNEKDGKKEQGLILCSSVLCSHLQTCGHYFFFFFVPLTWKVDVYVGFTCQASCWTRIMKTGGRGLFLSKQHGVLHTHMLKRIPVFHTFTSEVYLTAPLHHLPLHEKWPWM